MTREPGRLSSLRRMQDHIWRALKIGSRTELETLGYQMLEKASAIIETTINEVQ